MNTTAHILDIALQALVALTLFLLLWKGRDLYFLSSTRQLCISGLSDPMLDESLERLESGMALLAVVASSAAFVGLGGTVLNIMTALSHIKGAALDISVISGPIAEALNATLLGLASAVPAAAGYSLYSRRLQLIENRARRAFTSRTSAQPEATIAEAA